MKDWKNSDSWFFYVITSYFLYQCKQVFYQCFISCSFFKILSATMQLKLTNLLTKYVLKSYFSPTVSFSLAQIFLSVWITYLLYNMRNTCMTKWLTVQGVKISCVEPCATSRPSHLVPWFSRSPYGKTVVVALLKPHFQGRNLCTFKNIQRRLCIP